ncbi:MAG: primosomal protein N' [Candidatus Taylorbacteria bacterium]|nr:primosomal protein N' [Candidatus Taylorbacteria bacterium]
MQIIEVIPLTTLPPQVPQLLSYYFNKPLAKGAVVEVLIGNRKTLAAVISSTSVEEQKASLKKSSFQLKKISGIISEIPLISDIQFKIALWLSKNYYAPLGLCLKTVLPPFFLKKNYELPIRQAQGPEFIEGRITKYELKNNSQSEIRNPLILLSRAKDIIKNIEPEIKNVLKQKKQVLLIVPEISTAKYLYDHFAGYYETALIHGKVGLKQYPRSWGQISSGETEIIIGTRQSLFASFSDLGLVILEDSDNEAYKSDMTPKYNTVELAKKVSEIYLCPLVFVSQIPGISNYYNIKNGACEMRGEFSGHEADIKIADMVQEIRTGNFSVFSRSFTEQIREFSSKNKKILIFSSRKGFSGGLLCENCGFGFKCPQCSVPLRLHKVSEKLLICHRCSMVQKFPAECPNCHSYKLKSIGFPGSQKIEEELKKILANIPGKPEIFLMDSGIIKSPKTEEELMKKIENSVSCVCIATQMIFSHRYDKKFDLIGLPNADSLTVIPDFRSEERLFYQFYKLLDFEPEKVIIQTYNPDSSVLNMLVSGNYKELYEKELQLRKLFWYPPFARLVKLSFRHNDKQKAEYEARILGEKLKMAIVQRKLESKIKLLGPSSAFVEKEKNLYIYNIVLKILPDQRPDEILRFVPSCWMIDVDPRSIL